MEPIRSFVASLVFLLAAGLALPASAAADRPHDALGPGDNLRVSVFRNPELTTETRVSERGTIVFPLAGEVELGGLTPAQAGERIAARLKEGQFIVNPQVTVAVLEVRSRHVTVLGHVNRPGRFPLDDSAARLTDVLALAGGINPSGDQSVVVRSAGGEPRQIDYGELLRTGDASHNLGIRPGDVVFVPPAPMFYIYGEVHRAGTYKVERGMNIMQALAVGGGVTPRGTERGLRIHRRMPDGSRARIEPSLSDPVRPDDVIHVRESLF